MGGCATKPKDLNADADVPRPIEAPDPHPEDAGEKKDVVPAEETKEVAGAVLDDNRRRSLGTLFQENEIISEENEVPSSSTDKNVIIENTAQPSVEVEVKGKEQKEQDPDHPEKEHEPTIEETETLNPIKDEKSDAPIVKEVQEDLNTDAKQEKEEDGSEKTVVVDA